MTLETQSFAIEMQPVQSSNLAAVGYFAQRQVLRIQFNDGATYQYDGVAQHVYDGLMSAGSHGKYFHRVIKGVYPFRRM